MNFLYAIILGGVVAYYIARGHAHWAFGLVERDERPVIFWTVIASLIILALLSIVLGVVRWRG